MSKIIAIVSSPRKNGNTDTIVKAMADAAEAKGNSVTYYYLNDLKDSRGCQACMGCKKAGHCVVNDEILPILDAIRAADSVIVSAPDYFGQACSQYRRLEDRFYGFLGSDFTPNIATGKKVATVASCGSAIEGADAVADRMTKIMVSYLKFKHVGTVTVSDGGKKDAAANNAKVMESAREIGSKL